MQTMKDTTLRKCQEAVNLVYGKEHSLRSAAKTVGISSQTIYVYVSDYLSKDEAVLLRDLSKQNKKR